MRKGGDEYMVIDMIGGGGYLVVDKKRVAEMMGMGVRGLDGAFDREGGVIVRSGKVACRGYEYLKSGRGIVNWKTR